MVSPRRWIPAVLAVAWAGWILYLGVDQARRVPGLSDDASGSAQHVVAFAVLGALVMLAVRSRPLLVLVGLIAAGVVGEVIQLAATDRQFESVDIAMDAIGAAIGVGVVLLLPENFTEVAVPIVTIGLMAVTPFTPEAERHIPLVYPEDCGEAPERTDAEPQVILEAGELTDRALPHSIGEPTVAELRDRLLATNELSLEAWFETTDLSQSGPARVFTISDGTRETEVNVHIGVEGDDVSVRLRTSCNIFKWVGAPDVLEADRPQHVLFTWRRGRLTTWVNGVEVSRVNNRWGDFARWDPDYQILVGDEVGGGRPFDGTVHSVTMWDIALSDDEIVRRATLVPG